MMYSVILLRGVDVTWCIYLRWFVYASQGKVILLNDLGGSVCIIHKPKHYDWRISNYKCNQNLQIMPGQYDFQFALYAKYYELAMQSNFGGDSQILL